MKLTISYTTSRHHPEFEWFADSLLPQIQKDDDIEILVVDLFAREHLPDSHPLSPLIKYVEPKPNPWQGTHRLTPDDWWAKSSALNTSLCLATKPWWWMCDDRCVLSDTSLQAVRDAIEGNYIMCGTYEKRHNMRVCGGKISDWGKQDGTDGRSPEGRDHRELLGTGRVKAHGNWLFGCSVAMPIDWALQVNGWPEECDSCRHEDCIMGMMLENNKYPFVFDTRNKVIQDRTPGQTGPDTKASSKEKHQHDSSDKVHKILKLARGALCSRHPLNMRQIREDVQAGRGWPDVSVYGDKDWFDGQPIKEFK